MKKKAKNVKIHSLTSSPIISEKDEEDVINDSLKESTKDLRDGIEMFQQQPKEDHIPQVEFNLYKKPKS